MHAHSSLRERRTSLERGSQACEAVLRLLDSSEPNRPAYNLLCNELALLDAHPPAASRAQALGFRVKLLLAAGFAPELAACAPVARWSTWARFSPSAGGVVCAGCEAGSFPLAAEAHALPGRGTGPAARRGARGVRSRPCRRPTARWPRRSSTTPTSVSGGCQGTRRPGRYDLAVAAAATTKLVYDFAEGSRDMRDLLGGKGANVAEMTRVLGAERVPAGFTITTEACVAYMARAASAPTASTSRWTRRSSGSRSRPASGWATRPTRCWCRCARARASRCRACSTRCSTWA